MFSDSPCHFLFKSIPFVWLPRSAGASPLGDGERCLESTDSLHNIRAEARDGGPDHQANM